MHLKFVLRTKHQLTELVSGGGLRAETLRGGAWLGFGSIAEQLTRFVRNIILTRLLAPEAFGLMALVLSVSFLIDSFTEIGVKEAIVQHRRGKEKEYVNAAWWLAFTRSVALYAFVTLIAPLAARFYRAPELTALLRVSLSSILFYGATSGNAYVALKGKDFKRWTFVDHGSGVCGTILTIFLAFHLRNVWALALALPITGSIRMGLSYYFWPFSPSRSLNKAAVRDLVSFSRGVFGLSFLNMMFSRADIFVLGRLYSSADLGVYSLAVYLVQVPTSFILGLLSRLLIPTFAQIQDSPPRINRILGKITSIFVLLGMPAVLVLVISGRSILALLYGSAYSAAYVPLVLASLVAVVNILNAQVTSVFYSLGVPQLHRRCVALMAALMSILVFPAVKTFGFTGAQAAALFGVLAGVASQFMAVRRLTSFDIRRYSRSALASLVIFASFAAFFERARTLAGLATPVLNVVFGTVAGTLALATALPMILSIFKSEYGAKAHPTICSW